MFVVCPDCTDNENGIILFTSGCPSPYSCRSWFIDNSTNVTQGTYLVTGLNQTEEMTDYSFSYLYRSCPRSGCPRIRVDRGPVEAG